MFEYFKGIREILDKVEIEEKEAIMSATTILSEAIENKNAIFVFGASHAGILTQELYYRAGGLMTINPIFGERTIGCRTNYSYQSDGTPSRLWDSLSQ